MITDTQDMAMDMVVGGAGGSASYMVEIGGAASYMDNAGGVASYMTEMLGGLHSYIVEVGGRASYMIETAGGLGSYMPEMGTVADGAAGTVTVVADAGVVGLGSLVDTAVVSGANLVASLTDLATLLV